MTDSITQCSLLLRLKLTLALILNMIIPFSISTKSIYDIVLLSNDNRSLFFIRLLLCYWLFIGLLLSIILNTVFENWFWLSWSNNMLFFHTILENSWISNLHLFEELNCLHLRVTVDTVIKFLCFLFGLIFIFLLIIFRLFSWWYNNFWLQFFGERCYLFLG